MIDHVKLFVSDYAWSRTFYGRALAPLGYRLMFSRAGAEAGFGAGFPHLWISQSGRPTVAHVALRAPSRAAVAEFHAAAIAAGGIDNGAPGERRQYHPGYYAAFVLDRDGNNVEAVHHRPPAEG